MKRVRLSTEKIDQIAAEAAAVLQQPGKVVLVPTETVYGLIARADDRAAIERIFELKHRNASKRLGWFIDDWRKLTEYGVILSGLPEQLAAEYCPGALTIIAPCRDGSTLGFRVPDTPFLSKLLALVGTALVQTSANASGMPDALDCDEALRQLNGEADMVIDGGGIFGKAIGSTVVDATGERIKILRQGPVDLQKWL